MKMRMWRVEVGFNTFDDCPAAHDPLRVCEGCRQWAGTMIVDVEASSTTRAFCMALDQWCLSEYHAANYEIVALTLGGDPISPTPAPSSPPRASRRKPGSPPARKDSTETKTSGARGRSGKGQRKP
jgi:hypothetical protein